MRKYLLSVLSSVLLAGAAMAQPNVPAAPQPTNPSYEQLEHELAVAQEVANSYYMRAIQAEAQLTQLRAEQAVTAKETVSKSQKK